MKPLLKWVGGKSSILEEVLSHFPSEINDYYEPFLGGGSVLLGLLSSKKHNIKGQIYACDINPDLIHFYKNVKEKPQELIEYLKILQSEFLFTQEEEKDSDRKKGERIKVSSREEATRSKEYYYYWIRDCFNKEEKRDSPVCSAMLLFLNKTCFRGVYREGPNGFNVPYGNYKNPTILDEQHIREVSNLIQNVVFRNVDFSSCLNLPEEGDFVYLDPPYVPETEKSFVGYTSSGFSLEQHQKLFLMVKGLSCKFLLSNSAVPLVRDSFSGYSTTLIECRRAINSKNPESSTNEVLIHN